MSSAANKPLVLVVGGTGSLGQSLVTALVEYGAFRVATLTRPESASKPAVEHLKSIGVEIRLGDFVHDSLSSLTERLAGVDVVISTVSFEAILDQKNVLKAAKMAGVNRVVPCDFGTPAPSGIRALHDEKLEIRAFVRELGVPYTFIDVGWWTQLIFPYPSRIKDWVAGVSHEFHGTGDVKTATTNLMDVGPFVARIIEDPRTLNNYVFCWSEHVSQNEIYELSERVGGERFSDQKVHRSNEDVLRLAAESREKFNRGDREWAHAAWSYYEYANSMYYRGDNTVEKAKAQNALDARELYPDFKPMTLEESAKAFYSSHGKSS